MALTNAERKKRYLDKLKASGKFDDFKKKNAANEKKRRDRVNAGLEALPKSIREKTKRLKRQYTRRKVAEFRQRKKEGTGVLVETTNHISPARIQPDEGSYKTASALTKAVAKIKRALPSTPQKKKQAVAKLLKSFDPVDVQDMIGINNSRPKRTNGLSSSDVDLVKAFYERDDISRMSPNVKDCKKFVNPITGTKEYKQVRFLMYKLADVYLLFEKHVQNGNDEKIPPVQLSKFCALRPSHVKLVSSTPLDQCCCLYHQNFILCCAAINQNMPEFPKYGPKLERLILCRYPKQNCWLRKCLKCPNIENILANILKRSGKSKDDSTMCTRWVKNDDTNRFQKFVQRGTLENLLSHFTKILSEFLKHSYFKRNQAESFEKDNEEVKYGNGKVASLQVDYAENFNCEAQDEIQSAHWNQATVSLFTSCLKCSEELDPAVIASPNTKHTKNEIGCNLFKLISKLPSTVEMLKIWSDGPNNQFKNKYAAALLKLFEDRFKIKIFWNFFATSHGKGCVDGMGAVVKKRVRRLVQSRKAIVNCAKDFVDAFNSESSVIDLIYMSDDEATKIHNDLQLDVVFSFAPPVANIFSSHQLQVCNGKVIGFSTSKEGYDYYRNS